MQPEPGQEDGAVRGDEEQRPSQRRAIVRNSLIILAVVVITLAVIRATQSKQQDDSSAAAPTVTYSCTGSGDVTITYGAEGTRMSANGLPFQHTDTVDATAQYVVVSAQLQGGGSVSCSTAVTWSASGSQQSATKTASAEGGYNVAMAEVCSTADGWQAC